MTNKNSEISKEDLEMMQRIIKNPANSNPPIGVPVSVELVDRISTMKRRRLLVIGCGDGGTVISAKIKHDIPDTITICYNTSKGIMDKHGINPDIVITPEEQDGSGKSRKLSKNIFKESELYLQILDNVQRLEQEHPDIAMVVVVSSTDGGTGSGMSPMLTQLLRDNTQVPALLIGIYPSVSEGATSQYNMLSWQHEVTAVDAPYMIFDNEIPGVVSKTMVHTYINQYIADMLKVVTGDYYSPSTISSIDTMDLYTMLFGIGSRTMIVTSDKKPSTNQSLDDYLIDLIEHSYQPAPNYVTAMGLFVKGPASMLEKIDTSLQKVSQMYGGEDRNYLHIEESDDVQISLILSGMLEPTDRVSIAADRYKDIQAREEKREKMKSSASLLMEDMDDPSDRLIPTSVKRNHSENVEKVGNHFNMSALDL